MNKEEIKIKIDIDYQKVVNYVLWHNKIPICQNIKLTNESDKYCEDIQIVCEGEFVLHSESVLIQHLGVHETIRLSDFEIIPNTEKLAHLTERISSYFTLSIITKGKIIHEGSYEITLLPYDHWLGISIQPQTLVSLITPNHPTINKMVVETAEMMKKMTGQSMLTGYQSCNPNEVRKQVAAVFAAVHQKGIVYRGLPASYETIGQRITMPDQVLLSKIGNCIELTLLLATILEAIGINSVIVIQRGHAYLGVWLVNDSYPCSVCDDSTFIEKKCSVGINEMLVLECTMVTHENTSFEDAVKVAEHYLANIDLFELFIDVKRARLEQILPLPSRLQTGDYWTFETKGVEHDTTVIQVEEHDRYDLSKFAKESRQLTKFDIWERKLLDFSLRNTLLNLYLRNRAIQIISFDVDRIEDNLQDGEEYLISHKPNIDFHFDSSEKLIRSKLYEQELRLLISNDIEHHRLHSFRTESETRIILRNIYRASRNAIEESGANSLFLSIGTLRWFETDISQVPRYAPLLLLPVDIVYKKSNYYIRTRDEEISLNITLIEFIRQNYGIRIGNLDSLPKDNHGVDVKLIFAIIRDALKGQKRWDIEEECVLGTFSFSKFLMWNDIHSHHKQLIENPIVNSLVSNRLTWIPEPDIDNLKEFDLHVSPAETALPVPVDSSQMKAIIKGGKTHSFILYGPPGTGKSQTITNLIANALYQGKRVLFVAEKMAALSVVQSRLTKIGLDPFCLELHSNKSTKRHVLEQLGKALKAVHIVAPTNFKDNANKIFELRKDLIEHMNALHNVDSKDGLSLYDCILRYEMIEAEPLDGFMYETQLDVSLIKNGIEHLEELLGTRFEAMIKLVGQPSRHPLNGLRLDKSMIQDNNDFVENLKIQMTHLNKELSLNELSDTKELHDKLLRDNTVNLLNEDGKSLLQQWREANAKWFVPRFFAKRNFVKNMRQYNSRITESEVGMLIDDLISYQNKHERVKQIHQILQRYFPLTLNEDEIPSIDIFNSYIQTLERWIKNASLMRDWLHWSEFCEELESNGLSCIVSLMQKSEYAPTSLRKAYMKALFKYKAMDKICHSEALATFEGIIFDEKVANYKRMTEDFQILTQKELYARLASRVPHVSDNIESSSEIGLLNRNINNGGRGLSLRELFKQLPTIIPRLCPCMLMSPMSVAQYIDLNSDKFDLVIFDEASQMPTSEAIGAIARGKSLIVVGDPKQMPPTSFFSSTSIDEEEATIDDMESILEDCRTLEIPSLQLSWHYRSRHESLIAFSNNEYYDGTLITFPSADDQCTKVHLVPIKGFYDKGGKRQNKAEAEAIVQEIKRRLLDKDLHKKSIGVIAFSVVQQSLIEDLLQDVFDKDTRLRNAAEEMYEPIFVKNLENVQGDERDIILFSIGYGPNKEGKVSMNFGPLNNIGGERRLNVAVSRAREEMYIYSTLKSSDIDLRRSKARGVEGLKHFLEFAENQTIASSPKLQSAYRDTEFAKQIASELTKKGYSVTTNIGRSQFKIDLAIGDIHKPGVYKLGILLDGENYRDTHTTRDREIVQPSVLSALQWQIMRVWIVDWFNNPQRVLQRIEERLNVQEEKEQQRVEKATFDVSNEQIKETPPASEEYVAVNISKLEAIQMMNRPLIGKIITTEQPITIMYLCRRIKMLCGYSRVTPSLQQMVHLNLAPFYKDRSGALWLSEADSHNYFRYRVNSDRDVTDIPQVELINALTESLNEQIALNPNTLIFVAAKKLGFTRRGTNVDAAFGKAIEEMTANGLLETVGEKIRLKESIGVH